MTLKGKISNGFKKVYFSKQSDKSKKKMTNLTKPLPKPEAEKFFVQFSGTQLNAILLVILASTFLIQGVITYS
ncbi:MAG: hypothetical protein V1870_02185 [Candidatus Aenigmatarchaeota archaeon]